MRYYIQQQAPAGNYTDCLGCNSLHEAEAHYKFCCANWPNESFQLIERTDTPLQTYTPQRSLFCTICLMPTHTTDKHPKA